MSIPNRPKPDKPDRRNALIEPGESADAITAFTYDGAGNPVATTAPNGAVTAFTHDSLGRPLTESSPDRGDLVYTHDAADRLLTRTDARGITATYSYDALDRLVAVRYPDPGEDISLTHDDCPFGIGRLCAREDANGRYAFAYDADGRLTHRIQYRLCGTPP